MSMIIALRPGKNRDDVYPTECWVKEFPNMKIMPTKDNLIFLGKCESDDEIVFGALEEVLHNPFTGTTTLYCWCTVYQETLDTEFLKQYDWEYKDMTEIDYATK